jgi:hypothetical protein
MKTKTRMLLSVGLLAFINLSQFSQVYAGDCEITVGRAACPGKDNEAYEKCKGKPGTPQKCVEIKKKVGSAEACAREALKNCTVFRPGITKSKAITATFDGNPVESGKDFCQPEKPEFNWGQCR